MTAALAPRIVVAVALAVTAGCEPYQDDIPGPASPCLALPEGVRYEVTVGERYDSASDSYYDPTLVEQGLDLHWAPQGCPFGDAIATGAVVAFTTGRYSPAYDRPACSYREMREVTGLAVHAGRYRSPLGGVPGVTVAGWTREAVFEDELYFYTLALLAPGGDPMGEPVRGELPPALLARLVGSCADAWVVTVREVAR